MLSRRRSFSHPRSVVFTSRPQNAGIPIFNSSIVRNHQPIHPQYTGRLVFYY